MTALRASLFAFFVLFALLGNAASSGAATLRVPDDYATPQEAVNAAADGDTIRIGAGDFGGFSMVDRDGVTVVGQPGHRIVGGVSVSGSQAIGLRKLRIDGSISVTGSIAISVERCRVSGGVIDVEDGAGVVVTNNRLKGGGVFLTGVDEFFVRRNLVLDAGAVGVSVLGNGGIVKGNKVKGGAAGGGVRVTGNDVGIIKNRLEDVAGDGITVSGSNNRIEGNEVLGAGNDGILCPTGASNRFADNLVKRTGDGIDVKDGCSANQVVGNRVKNVGLDGIDIDSSGNTVSGNRIKRTGDTGIQLIASGNSVSGNVIQGVGSTEIRDDAGGNTLSGNVCPDSGGACN